MRVRVGSRHRSSFGRPLSHDDVVIVPELICDEDDLSLYHKLVEEMRGLQAEHVPNSEWISWHEGCHLISKAPDRSPTFQRILDKMSGAACTSKKNTPPSGAAACGRM